MKKIFSLLLLVFYASSVFAQILTLNQGKIKQKHYFQEITYQEIKGLLVIPVTINGKIYNFLFDTGATLAISDKIFKELNLRVIRQGNAVDASGESEKARLILLPEIDIQGIIFLNTPGGVFPENNETVKLAECLEIDGIIGSNMLRNSVVQFDAQNNHIIITNDIKRVLLQNSEYQKMKLSSWTSHPYLKITLQKREHRAVHEVLFDSGDAGDVFTYSLNQLNGYVVDTIAESEGSFAAGAHGLYKKQKHLLLNIPKFEVSGTKFTDMIVTTTHDNSSRIGAKLLQYGKTTLDYKKKRFYFEPFDNINTSKPVENYWAINPTFQNDKIVVGIIWNKLLESQINLGDEILSINGINVQPMDLCEFFMLKIPDSDKRIYEFRDINTGEIKTVEIERMELNK
jgi:predicted aspartyl protease